MAVIALDLGGTKLAAAMFDPSGKILARSRTPLSGESGSKVGDLLRRRTSELMERARAASTKITAVGICVPGISHPDTGRVWAPNIPGWEDYPLRDEIRAVLEAFKPSRAKSVPEIRIESDRACYISGEEWKGAARGCQNAIFLAVGTGIGAGLLVDGRIVNGAHGTAGAIGWLALQRPHTINYEKCGCFEFHASGAGLARAGQALAGTKAKRHVTITAREVFASFEKDESMGRKVIGDAIQFWGMAVANLVSLFDPEVIVFGGGVFGPARKLIARIQSEAEKWAQPIAIKHVKLAASRLGSDAGLYGAARSALRSASDQDGEH